MLTTKRPTRTTVLYTVSTRSPAKTLSAIITKYASILLRIAAGILITAILLHDFAHSATFTSTLLALHLKSHLTFLPATLPFSGSTRLLVCSATTWLIFRKSFVEESLLVIRGLGVQTSTSSASWLGIGGTTRFIPTREVREIFIGEAFRGFEVRFFLGIVVEGEGDVVVVFPEVLPEREVLERVWRGARGCLYEPKV